MPVYGDHIRTTGNRNTLGYAPRVATRFAAGFDTWALSTAHRRSSNLADRDTQLRCHGGQIGDTNVRWSYASRVMPWLMQAPLNLVEFVVDRFLALDVLAV